LSAAGVKRGSDLSDPKTLLRLADELAEKIAVDPDNRDSAPRADVRSWLTGKKYILPRRAFRVGQVLGKDFEGVPPYCSGIVALHASGHFPETIGCLMALMRNAEYAPSPYPEKNRSEIKADIAIAEQARTYAFACVGLLWTVHSDLGGIGGIQIAQSARVSAPNHFPNSPIKSCENAWNSTQPISEQSGSVVYSNVPNIGLATRRGNPYASALVGWAALAEEAWQCSMRSCSPSIWDEVRPILQAYMEIAHKRPAIDKERNATK